MAVKTLLCKWSTWGSLLSKLEQWTSRTHLKVQFIKSKTFGAKLLKRSEKDNVKIFFFFSRNSRYVYLGMLEISCCRVLYGLNSNNTTVKDFWSFSSHELPNTADLYQATPTKLHKRPSWKWTQTYTTTCSLYRVLLVFISLYWLQDCSDTIIIQTPA